VSERRLDLTQTSVLIVEPNVRLHRLYSDALTAFGTGHVSAVSDWDGALARFGEERPHLAFVEVLNEDRRPVGLDWIRRVRREFPFPSRAAPIVASSALTTSRTVCEARDAGANDFMKKPFGVCELFRQISRVVDFVRPFVVDHNYVGPCRRSKEQVHQGPERRLTKQLRAGSMLGQGLRPSLA
jgi:DNA-binding response OmpR family regulator